MNPDDAPNAGSPTETRAIELSGIPPEVRKWITTNFRAFRIDGFDNNGAVFERVYASDTMSRFALLESLRRTLTNNSNPIPVDTGLELEDGG